MSVEIYWFYEGVDVPIEVQSAHPQLDIDYTNKDTLILSDYIQFFPLHCIMPLAELDLPDVAFDWVMIGDTLKPASHFPHYGQGDLEEVISLDGDDSDSDEENVMSCCSADDCSYVFKNEDDRPISGLCPGCITKKNNQPKKRKRIVIQESSDDDEETEETDDERESTKKKKPNKKQQDSFIDSDEEIEETDYAYKATSLDSSSSSLPMDTINEYTDAMLVADDELKFIQTTWSRKHLKSLLALNATAGREENSIIKMGKVVKWEKSGTLNNAYDSTCNACQLDRHLTVYVRPIKTQLASDVYHIGSECASKYAQLQPVFALIAKNHREGKSAHSHQEAYRQHSELLACIDQSLQQQRESF